MEEKKKYLIKYVTVDQVKRCKDKKTYAKPKSITVKAETERAAMYLLWTGKKGPDVDHIISVTEISEAGKVSPAVQYKVGWYDRDEKRKYKVVETKAEAVDLITSLMDYPGQISVKQITPFTLNADD